MFCFPDYSFFLVFPIFMQFLQFHNECNIVTWVKEYFCSTVVKGTFHLKWGMQGTWKQTSVTVFLFYFRNILKFGHKVLTECGKTKLQTLCLIFDSPFGKFFPNMKNLPFASQNNDLLFSPIICIFSNAVANIVSLIWLSSFLGVLWKASTPFEIRYI